MRITFSFFPSFFFLVRLTLPLGPTFIFILCFRPLEIRALRLAHAIHPIFLPPLIATHHRFPSPSKQPPPDKTRVVNSTRRKPTHLSLSTTHPPRELGDLLEILTATFLFGDARQYRMSLISDLSFESFSSRGHFSCLASKASTPCRLIQSVVQRDLD